MAKRSKKKCPGLPSLVTKILTTDRENIAQLLEEQCLEIVNSDSYQDDTRNKVVIAMIRDVAANGNAVELVLASQYIALSLSGMNILSQKYINSKGQGMQLIRLSHAALETLEKYRNNQKAALNQFLETRING